jgi:hypothetical protein
MPSIAEAVPITSVEKPLVPGAFKSKGFFPASKSGGDERLLF